MRKCLLVFFYTSVFMLAFSFIFFMLFREPYPSFNMPSFATTKAKNEQIKVTSFYGVLYHNDSKVWEGDIQSFFPDMTGAKYTSRMRYLFFDDIGTRTARGDSLRKQLFVKIFGNTNLFETIHSFVYPAPPANHHEQVSELLCKQSPVSFDKIEIRELKTMHRLKDGAELSEKISRKSMLMLEKPCVK